MNYSVIICENISNLRNYEHLELRLDQSHDIGCSILFGSRYRIKKGRWKRTKNEKPEDAR